MLNPSTILAAPKTDNVIEYDVFFMASLRDAFILKKIMENFEKY